MFFVLEVPDYKSAMFYIYMRVNLTLAPPSINPLFVNSSKEGLEKKIINYIFYCRFSTFCSAVCGILCTRHDCTPHNCFMIFSDFFKALFRRFSKRIHHIFQVFEYFCHSLHSGFIAKIHTVVLLQKHTSCFCNKNISGFY